MPSLPGSLCDSGDRDSGFGQEYAGGEAIRARDMDSFCVGGQVITLDTTDFSKVDWKELYCKIEKFRSYLL